MPHARHEAHARRHKGVLVVELDRDAEQAAVVRRVFGPRHGAGERLQVVADDVDGDAARLVRLDLAQLLLDAPKVDHLVFFPAGWSWRPFFRFWAAAAATEACAGRAGGVASARRVTGRAR